LLIRNGIQIRVHRLGCSQNERVFLFHVSTPAAAGILCAVRVHRLGWSQNERECSVTAAQWAQANS